MPGKRRVLLLQELSIVPWNSLSQGKKSPLWGARVRGRQEEGSLLHWFVGSKLQVHQGEG